MFNRITSTKFIAPRRQAIPNQNPKSEYRNPKQPQTFTFQLRNLKRARLENFDHLKLFRISDFEFSLCFSMLGALCDFARAICFSIPFSSAKNFKCLWLELK